MLVAVHIWYGFMGFSLLSWKTIHGPRNANNNASVASKYSSMSAANRTPKNSLLSTRSVLASMEMTLEGFSQRFLESDHQESGTEKIRWDVDDTGSG